MTDHHYMHRALELAARGLGLASPNPMVGCVIVKEGRVLGEGWHKKFGGPHAEVEAVRDCASEMDVQGATVYVTLEPCSHFGKTPPCADLIVRLKPARVVVAMKDPFALVDGRGLDKLQAGGIATEVGLLEQEALFHNRRFLVNQRERRPYVVLKWAQTADGFMAPADGSPKWISSPLSRARVHQWRAEEDAILVGHRTWQVDKPRLDVRGRPGRNPLPIVMGQANGKARSGAPTTPSLANRGEGLPDALFVSWPENAEQLLQQMRGLYLMNDPPIGSVLIEGGPRTLKLFVEAGMWDEARVLTSDAIFDNGFKALAIALGADRLELCGGDQVATYFNPQSSRHWS